MNNHYPKTDLRYWEARVTFQIPASRTYSVHIQHANRRAWIGLRTANKGQAAILARKLYQELVALGWEETLRRRKGLPAEKKVNVTIGEYLDAVKGKSLIHAKTIESYGAALRKIASDVHGVTDKKRSTRRTRVDAIKLATLSAEKIEILAHRFHQAWRNQPAQGKERSCVGKQFYRLRPVALWPRCRCSCA